MVDVVSLLLEVADNKQINPYLECVIETNPDALEQALQLDQERKQGRIRGALHGIPVLVKDVSCASCCQTRAH